MPHIVVGTAGHIDHGKTALVKAITGIDTDRLKEEKERGITIDLGFAHLALDGTTTVSFIDVPGHERFIKNMLAGVGGIDLVMLVIAADESVMPQTREHLEICSLLHIKQGFTVLTKIDKTEPAMADLVELEVRDFLKGSFLADSPIVRVSSTSGDGIPRVVDTLKTSIHKVEAKDDADLFRLPIDRSFTMKGFGTVVTGTLIAGTVRRDDEVEIFPQKRRLRVRGIQVHGRSATEAKAGQRTALNLQGIDVAEVQRGMVLAQAGLLDSSSMFDCFLELLPSAPHPIESRKRIRFHTGTAELMGYVVLLGRDRLVPGESGFVQIRLEEPTLALAGDRFIIRQYSPMITIGGGEIIESTRQRHRRMDQSVLTILPKLKDGSITEQVMTVVERAGLKTMELVQIAGARGIAPSRVGAQVDALVKAGRIRVVGENPRTVIAAGVFQNAAENVLTSVKQFHQENPLVPGVGREELKVRALGDAPNVVFQAVLEKLVAEKKIAMSQDRIHEFGRKVTLKADEELMRSQLTDRFRALALQVPTADEIIDALKLDRNTARKIIQLMVKENHLVKVNDQMFVDASVIEKLVADVRAMKSKNPKLGVAEFKTLTGVTRKHAIPLLEFLDRQRVTRRMGDERLIL